MPEAAAPPAPSPTPAAQPAAPPSDTPAFNDFASRLDAISQPLSDAQTAPAKRVAKEAKPEPQKEQQKANDPANPEAAPDKPVAGDKPQLDAKPDTAKGGDKPAEAGTPKTPRPWEMFRTEKKAREELQAKYEATVKELETLRSQKPEFDPTKHPEFVKYRTRAEELEGEIKFINYEKSQEFKEKFLEPYTKAATELTKEATEFIIETKDEVSGQVSTRPLKAEEFWNVVRSTTAEEAYRAAKQLFPDDPAKVSDLLSKRKEIAKAWNAMDAAKQEYRTKGAEREKQLLAEKQQQEQREQQLAGQRAEQFKSAIDADLQHPERKEFFVAPDDDPKGKEILTKGFNFADKAFGVVAEGDQPFSDDEAPAAHAALRNRAASWPYMKHLLLKERALRGELEKKLAEYEKSEPGSGVPPKGEVPKPGEDLDSVMGRLDKLGR